MESRKYHRIFLEIPTQVVVQENNKQNLIISNLSNGGAFVLCEEPYEQNTIVNIIFSLPNNHGDIEATGFVCWKGKNQYDGKLGMGIQFLVLSDEHQQRLKNFIEATDKLISHE